MKAQGYWWHRQYPSIRKKKNTFEIPRIWAPLSIYSLGSKVKNYYKSSSVLVALPIPLRYKPNNVKDWLIWDLEYDYWKLWKILRCSSKIWHVYIHNILTHLMFYNILFINIKFKINFHSLLFVFGISKIHILLWFFSNRLLWRSKDMWDFDERLRRETLSRSSWMDVPLIYLKIFNMYWSSTIL